MIKTIEKIVKGSLSMATGLKLTLINFIRKPVTLQYPWQKAVMPERFRTVPRVYDFFNENTINSRSMLFSEAEMPPCIEKCPANTDIRGYISAICEGRYEDGVRILKDTYPFSASLGRVCPAPCQSACNHSFVHKTPQNIKFLKRFLSDFDMSHPPEKRQPLNNDAISMKPERVAIIGAGPAGLTCAVDLAKMGYNIEVYEKLPVAGGYLAVGIPDYRLPAHVLKMEIDAIEQLGIKIFYNKELGKNLSIDGLLKEGFKAIFIGIGATLPMNLGIPGEDSVGVMAGEAFLEDVNLNKNPKIGKNVAVIGGGNTAIDSARCAKRLGCSVTILYRRTKNEMPADHHEINDAEEEEIIFEYLVTPLEVISETDTSGNKIVKGIKCLRNRLGAPDASGRRRPIPIEGSEFVYECETILTAISRSPDTSKLSGQVNCTKWGTVDVNFETGLSSKPGIFAGGDVTLGPKTVIEAIACGKRAARGIAEYIQKESTK